MGQFGNHRRWCDKNPNVELHRRKNIDKAAQQGIKKFGEYKVFRVQCGACGRDYDVKEREKLFPQKSSYFCSRSCANSVGGKAKAQKHYPDDIASYTAVAWRYHDKRCVVCGESNIVAVHHLNENHNDNDPKNLVPLCPTHHQYMHSRYKQEIQEFVDNYVRNKWG